MTTETLPWGETLDELAEAVLDDPNAPIFLQLAAVKHRLGMSADLRGLVRDAIDLHETETDK